MVRAKQFCNVVGNTEIEGPPANPRFEVFIRDRRTDEMAIRQLPDLLKMFQPIVDALPTTSLMPSGK